MKKVIYLALLLSSFIGYSQYSFFVAGHIYGTPGTDSVGFYYPFKEKVPYIQSRTEIKFGVFTGDIVKSSDVTHWDAIDSDIVDLGLPVYFAFGNHDMYNRPLVESRYGDSYYYFIYQNDLFIILDPNIDSWRITGEQFDFLQNTLDSNASTCNNIFVLFHQLMWWEPDNIFKDIVVNSLEGRADTLNFWTEIEPLFHNLPNNVVMFAGDVGATWQATDVMYYKNGNLTLIASGMGSQNGDNFVVVNVDSLHNISYDLISLTTPDIDDMGNLEDYEVVGINDIAENLVNIYPNPTHNFINIQADYGFNKVSIYDISGKEIYNQEYKNTLNVNIDVSNFDNGVYFIKILNSNNIELKSKFIKF